MRTAVVYRGRVQGVGFRATARHLAAQRPLTGWVRNEADGSVRLEVQGDAAEIDTLVAEIQSALGRNITGAECYLLTEQPGERGFQILR